MGSVGSNLLSSISSGGSQTPGSLGTGIDVTSLVTQLMSLRTGPLRLLQTQQQNLKAQSAAITDINAKLLDLQSKVNSLKDLSGAFNSKTAASSQAGILTAAANVSAATGNHTVTVGALATTSSYYTGQLANGTTTFATGTFNLQVGSGTPVTITVDSTNNTLNGLASAINSLGAGVTASVISDAGGARLSLVSNTSGSPGDLTIPTNTTGLSFTKAVSGTNASLTVDGVPISSASNTVSTVIPGVTLNLLSAAPSSPVTVSVQPAATQASAAINDFVTSYNALVQAMNAQFSYNSATQQAGPLSGDSTLLLLQQQLFDQINNSIPGNNGFGSLAAIGVTMNNDGTLTVDSATLNNALASNYADVQNMFQSASPAGFAQSFSTILNNLTDAVNGPLNLELNGITQSQTDLTSQINDLQSQLLTQQQQLTTQYSQINAILQQLPSLLAQINSQLSGLH